MTNLTEEQGIIVRAPLQGSIFLQGKAGTGKSTAGVNRMLHLVQSGCAADSILVMVPQRSLAQDYYNAVHHPDYPAAGHPSILTFGGLAQRMVSLFWPVIAKAAGFKKPTKPPKFLTLETAQYYLAGIVEPLVEKGYFDSVTIDPNRLYSQILDNLNKSAVVGFPPTEIASRLTEAWVGKPTQVTIYEQAQECALLFRNFCFQHNLLDFSLQLSVFQNFLWPSLICRKYLQNTFKHLIYDNIEEDIPIAHDMVADFLPGLESALLIMDSDAGFRTFLGADPISAFQLSKLCSGSMNFTDSFTSSADLQVLESNLAASIVNRTGSNKKIQLNSTFDVESFRFYPEAIDWACRVIRQLMDQDSVEPADIAVLTPFLSDSLRFTFATGFNDSGIPFLTYRPSRSLRDEPIIQAIMTLVKISNPSWGMKPSKQDVRNAFMCSIEGCDMVRAELLTQMLYSPALSPVFLKPFGPVKPEMQTRITYVVGERYEQLREWISSNQESGNEELDHWISRLFGEVLSQPGFGIHSDFDAAVLVSRLIESCKGFRNGTIAPGGKPQQFGKEYARVLSSGILAAQSLSTWVQQSQTNSVFLSPAFSFLMSNRPVKFQFWIDIGSHGWWSRLDQPLTQPYVLNRNWQRGQKWTDEDEFHNNQRSLLNVTSGLLRRCREHVYLCTIGLNEQGVEERGALVMAVQDLLRRQKIARGERDVKPRQSQVEILKYDHGKMGISAVPGSGKTHTLSYLAAQLILDGKIRNDQEILIVTLVNSAVDNFSTRIGDFIHQSNLLENVGYRVRTLHGLAHDIVRERPDLAGISDQFTIIDESESNRMVEMISSGYLREHPEMVDALVKPDINLSEDFRARSSWSELIPSMNQQFISLAKDLQLEPTDILEKVEKFGYSNMLVDMGVDVYTQYQRGLRYRNALDFSDLVRLALRVLTNDADFLARLRDRWPYILEDEAQDSSGIQEMILRLLSGEDGNWVRVGDPNQAIYETFTTANPKYLRNFLKEKGVTERSLPNSGRSSKKIIDLANFLIKWTKETPPHPGLRDALDTPFIQPTPPGDPQPNPDNLANAIYIQGKKLTPDQEIKTIVRNIKQWLPANLDKTIAVLCPIGNYAEQVIDALITEDIEVVELLQTNLSTRKTARVLEKVLSALAEPSATKKYSQAFQEIYSQDDDAADTKQELSDTTNALSRLQNLEDFFYPRAGGEWRRVIGIVSLSETALDRLDQFRIWFINWHQAAALPIDQLLLSISQSLFSSPAELALCHKFALMLEFSAQLHPDYGLVDFSNELKEISSSARKFSGFSDTETRFDPDAHKGKVFVSTFHKAKGMEWDRVYLMSVNNYDFPSAQVFDSYKGEKWFIRENYNPPAELLSKLEALKTEDTRELFSEEGKATQDARVEYARERLRLLFVGITRARRSLVITWNTGKKGNMNKALPLEALHAWWQEENETTD